MLPSRLTCPRREGSSLTVHCASRFSAVTGKSGLNAYCLHEPKRFMPVTRIFVSLFVREEQSPTPSEISGTIHLEPHHNISGN
jgi:hypothetical protein